MDLDLLEVEWGREDCSRGFMAVRAEILMVISFHELALLVYVQMRWDEMR